MPENNAIRLSYTLDEATFLEATRAMWRLARQHRKIRLRGYFFAALLPLGAWLAVRFGMMVTFLAIIGINLVHWVFDWPIARAIARRQFTHLPGAGARMDWRIDESGFHIHMPGAEPALIRWDMLSGATEVARGFILAQPGNVHHWLPKDAFDSEEDIATLRAWLRQRLPTREDEQCPAA